MKKFDLFGELQGEQTTAGEMFRIVKSAAGQMKEREREREREGERVEWY